MDGYLDYERRRRPGPGPFHSMRLWNVTTWLIAVNVAVFVLDRLAGYQLSLWGYFSAETAVYGLQAWRFISFQFLHANLEHLFFNMLSLYFFGSLIESYLGARRYLAFYLLCGASGAALYLGMMFAGILEVYPTTPLVGASAGIFGILIAAAQIAPNATVMLMFPPIPMKLRTLALIFLGWAALTIIRNGHNAGGEAAHLGGAVLGYFLINNPRALSVFDFRLSRRPPDRWE